MPANVPTARLNQQAHQVGNSVFTSASKGPNSRFHVNPFAPRKQDKLNRSIRARSIASPLLSTLRLPWEPGLVENLRVASGKQSHGDLRRIIHGPIGDRVTMAKAKLIASGNYFRSVRFLGTGRL